MSSVQTGQLISLLVNNVLMVIIVMTVTLAAWLRWCWLRSGSTVTRGIRRRCRWAYLSFVLTVATLLGMLTSLGVLTLRAMIAVNALVVGAMAIFLLSVITLLIALGLWFVDLCSDLPAFPVGRRSREGDLLHAPPIALLPASMATGTRRRRVQRRQRR
ncbi:hypothetical protein D0962_34060 [Leptolyngbyaceae cyanobacterium CCMR0082]|uniref:Uncharacterized protein n=1 Tax=Adonisia turfae CCMR0082 TaxID=2304604 RepID=A0A6M0SGP6_9CYAN|nr:hypothetical protein [Adonisia turfae]MDV3350709.1 hypothetical protein [Leptothoe sp. LEGE 181152]NEZ67729.1 hypothetical protein [Adonisia turfae CCMR0082]